MQLTDMGGSRYRECNCEEISSPSTVVKGEIARWRAAAFASGVLIVGMVQNRQRC
jgi:hypothetical protein